MQTDDQQFYLEIFEGPLDLLLYLIRRDEVDIYDIPIRGITEQYLKYLDLMKILDLDVAGEFLAMAATLMHIKSQFLLPPEERVEEEEEDPRWELVKQLLEYRRFKSAADDLQRLELKQEKHFPRGGSKIDLVPPPADLPLVEVNIFELLEAFSRVLTEADSRMPAEMEPDYFSLEDGRNRVLSRVGRGCCLTFEALFDRNESRGRIVVIFLAVLELVRQKIIRVIQESHFGKIMVEMAVN